MERPARGGSPMRRDRLLAWAGGLTLLALHLDFWRPQRVRLVLGWMPEDLAWRLAWMGLAALYLLFFCARVWRDEEPDA